MSDVAIAIPKADGVTFIIKGKWQGCSIIGEGSKQIPEYQRAFCLYDGDGKPLLRLFNEILAMRAIEEAGDNLFLAESPTKGTNVRVTKEQMLAAVRDVAAVSGVVRTRLAKSLKRNEIKKVEVKE
jgi:hypothetical protein